LEEVGLEPTQEELTEENLSEEEVEQQLNDGTVELESVAEWKTSSIRGCKYNMGDQDNLPTDKVELQPRRLHKKSQPLEQLDRVIEDIRKMMLSSAEAVSKEDLNRREHAIATGKKKKKMQQQQHSWRGARGC
jgi:hypothetical protein